VVEAAVVSNGFKPSRSDQAAGNRYLEWEQVFGMKWLKGGRGGAESHKMLRQHSVTLCTVDVSVVEFCTVSHTYDRRKERAADQVLHIHHKV